jgi:hypothetical protein
MTLKNTVLPSVRNLFHRPVTAEFSPLKISLIRRELYSGDSPIRLFTQPSKDFAPLRPFAKRIKLLRLSSFRSYGNRSVSNSQRA